MENSKNGEEILEKMKKLKQNKKITTIIICVLVVILAIMLICFGSKKEVGNTIGNIRNYGYSVEKDGWIYFFSPNADCTQVGIFRMKSGDKEQKTKEQLAMDKWNVFSFNVVDDYIYFISLMQEDVSETDNINNKIYKMKTDGTDLRVINDNEFKNDSYEIYVVGKSIYYVDENDDICKMDLNGRHRKLVKEADSGFLGITDKYIIYNVVNEDENVETDYITYICDLNGKNSRPILENTRLANVNVIGDYIYYVDDSQHICKVKLDGTKNETLYEEKAYNMNVTKDYIYYYNFADEENEKDVNIYRLKTDGSSTEPESIKALTYYSDYLNIVGDWAVHYDMNLEESLMNFVKIDGTEEIKVFSYKFEEESETEVEEEKVVTP